MDKCGLEEGGAGGELGEFDEEGAEFCKHGKIVRKAFEDSEVGCAGLEVVWLVRLWKEEWGETYCFEIARFFGEGGAVP